MRALLIVDLQNDFCPGGTLAVPAGDEIIPVINGLMASFPQVIASRDWHPLETLHFQKWPIHCVADTPGADYHADLYTQGIDVHLLKGTSLADDGYSAFEATNENLAELLRIRGITELYVCGLATDYCVHASAMDARKAGFATYLITDASRGVDLTAGDSQRAIADMAKAGVTLLTAAEAVTLV
jgi:nicotinamidase/pyrazinamidase